VTVATDSVRNALEQSPEKVVSHLHPEGSFEIADHVVPTGREEVWRFTPLKRLRGIHQDAPLDGHSFTVEVHAADGVTAEAVGVDHESRGTSGIVPPDRVSARAWAAADSVFLVDVPKEHVGEEATTVTLTGTGNDVASAGHLVIRAGAFAKATVVIRFQGTATLAENVDRRRRRRRAHRGLAPGLGRRRRAPLHPARPDRPRRDLAPRGGLLRR